MPRSQHLLISNGDQIADARKRNMRITSVALLQFVEWSRGVGVDVRLRLSYAFLRVAFCCWDASARRHTVAAVVVGWGHSWTKRRVGFEVFAECMPVSLRVGIELWRGGYYRRLFVLHDQTAPMCATRDCYAACERPIARRRNA